jgi:hypothetical protein
VRQCLELKLILLALGAFGGMYFFIAWLTPNFISIAGVESPTVLSRIILHFFPLSALALILLHAPLKNHDSGAHDMG